MTNDLAVTLLQTTLASKKPEENYNRISGLLENAPLCDVIILPEKFSTGFSMEPDGVAERHDPDGMSTIELMKALSASLSAAVTGSVLFEDGGRHFNRM
jgi:predicted amidohydrolase